MNRIVSTITRRLTTTFLLLCAGAAANSQEQAPDGDADLSTSDAMTAERLAELVMNIDEDARFNGNTWLLTVAELEVGVVFDVAADRMRIIIPIEDASELSEDELLRLMQANFDSALDARYAIANGRVWGTFIHPLSSLTDDEFLTGMGETANIVLSYGTSYSSGIFMYGGGDSAEIQRQELIEELKKKTI